MSKQLALILFIVISSVTATGISRGNTNMWEDWETVSTNFFKNDNPYGVGNFHIRGNQVISFKQAEAETLLKPDSVEYTEAWMNDIDEQINRRSVRILTGTIDGAVRRVFDKPAQQGAWWLSPDWNTIYVSTGWMDYHQQPVAGERYTPQVTKLFKSTDQGQTWQQLKWREDANIGQMAFLDKQRGYLIGWGPHIWRTADGGASWTEIPVPPQVKDPTDSRKEFDMIALGKDGVLRFSFTVQNPQQQVSESQIYALGWNDAVPALAFSLPAQVVSDIIEDQHSLYIISWRGTSVFNVDSPAKTTLFRFANQNTEQLYEFDQGFQGYSLYITPGGGILIGGEDSGNYSGLIALSYDQGKSWEMVKDRSTGGYYDTESGTAWKVAGYILLKRQIR